MITFYGYSKCSTCQKAKKHLMAKKKKFQEVDITEKPPSKKLLKDILKTGDYTINDLFNKSGILYRELNMKEKIKKLSETQLLDLLVKNGKLVKRPLISDGKKHTVGFREDAVKAWK